MCRMLLHFEEAHGTDCVELLQVADCLLDVSKVALGAPSTFKLGGCRNMLFLDNTLCVLVNQRNSETPGD